MINHHLLLCAIAIVVLSIVFRFAESKFKLMIYFKTVRIPDYVSRNTFETAMRRSSIKKTTVLDFKSSIIDFNRTKDFLGYDNGKFLSFTRTKISLEYLLPKLIIRLSNVDEDNTYQIRLAALPFTILLFICWGIILTILHLIQGDVNTAALLLFGAATIAFWLLLMLELRITIRRITNILMRP